MKLFKHEMPCPGYKKKLHVYCVPEVWTPENEAKFLEQILLKQQIFSRIGKAGELYARSLFLKAEFPYIPPKGKVGEMREPRLDGKGEIKADLLFKAHLEWKIIKILVEVKNCREHYCRRDFFNRLCGRAEQVDAQPVFIAAHISPSGKKICKERGIAFLELGFQVLPNLENKKLLKTIPENILGKHEYRLINPKRPFHHGVFPEAEEHIKTISQESWIADAHRTWMKMNKPFP